MNLMDLSAKLTLDSSQYESALGRVGGLARSAFSVVTKAVAAATTAVTAFAGASVKVGMAFDSSMSQVAATMGYTVDELNSAGSEAAETYQTLSEFAQKMGSETVFSATQAADALNYMALAGYDAATSMETLPTVLNLAAAGSMELARASDMITDTQSALGLSMEETTALVDQMAKTASKSNTSVTQLGDAMLTIGGTAQFMAGGTDRLQTVLGLLADNGIKGSEAGTHLRNMILKLSSPTAEGAKAIERLSLDVFDAEGKMRDMQDIILDLGEAMSSMTEAEKVQTISELFNARDLSAVNALLGTSRERWEELGAAIADSEGAAQAMAEVQLDNLQGDITLFKSALEGAQIAISDQLTPSLREFVQFGSSSISRLTSAFKEGGISGAMGELGTILSEGISIIVESLPEWIEAGMSLLSALGQGLIKNLPAITSAASQIIVMLATYLVKSLPEIVKAGFQLIVQLANGIADALPELIPAIVDVVLEIVDTLTNPDNLSALLGAALSIITALASGLIEALPLLIERLPEIVENIVTFIAENLPFIVQTVFDLCIMLASAVIQNLPLLLSAVGEILSTILGAVWNGLVKISTAVWNWFNDNVIQPVAEFFEKIWQSIEDFFQPLIDFISPILEALSYLFETIWEAIKKVVSDVLDDVWEKISSVWNTVSNFINDEILKPLKNAFGEAWNAIYDKIEEPLNKVWNFITGIFNDITGFIGGILEDAKTWGKDLIENFVSGIREKIERVGEVITSVADKIRGLIGFSEPEDGPLSNFHTYAPDMMKLFAQGIKDNERLVQDQIEKSFNFGAKTVDVMPRYGAVAFGGAAAEPQEIVINLTSEIDGATLARKTFRYNVREQQRHGEALVSV